MSKGKRIGTDWAKDHIAALKRGETVSFRPVGGSMTGIIESGQMVMIAPAPTSWSLYAGTVVLVQVGDFTYLHLIKKASADIPSRYLIGNNRGGISGWVDRDAIHGVLLSVDGKYQTQERSR